MAVKLSIASTNFATATTWSDAWSLGQQLAGASATTLTTSFQYSATATGDGTAIRYSLFKCSVRSASPGAETVTFELNVDGVASATVTINKSDIPADGNCWIVIDWGSSKTLTNAKLVKVGIKTSATTSGATSFLRDSTAANWDTAYFLNAASGAAPTTGDTLYIMGLRTGAGAQTAVTVTMNQNSATAIGDINVGDGGTLTWTTGSTTLLTTSGSLTVWAGGTHNWGTSGTSISASVTSTLDFTGASKTYAVNAGATDNRYGAALTRVYDRASSTANSGQAVIVTASDNSADWNQWGKLIAVAGTNRSTRDSEQKTISSISTTSITCTGNLTNSHNGTNTGGFDMRAHVVMLSRNNILRLNTGATGFTFSFGTTATVNWQYAEHSATSTGTSAGGTISTTTGSSSIKWCSFHDLAGTNSSSDITTSGASWNNTTIQHNVFYACAASNFRKAISNIITSGTTYTIDDNIAIMMCTGNGTSVFTFADIGGTITNMVAVDSASTTVANGAIVFSESGAVLGTCSGHEGYSNAGYPFVPSNSTLNQSGSLTQRQTVSSCNFWRNNVGGFAPHQYYGTFIFSSCKMWANTSDIDFTNQFCDGIQFLNCTFDQGSGTTSTQWLNGSAGHYLNATFIGCTFGSTNAYTTFITASAGGVVALVNFGSTLSFTNIWASQTLSQFSFIESFDDGGVAAAYKLWANNGVTTTTGMEASDTTHGEHTVCSALNPNVASNALGNNCQHWLEGVPYISGTAPIPTFRLKSFGSWNGKAYISIFFKGQLLQGPTEITGSINSSTFTNCSITGATPTESLYYDALLEYSGTTGGLYLDAEGDAALDAIS